MINTIVMEGRLTVDPVLKTTLDGKEFCTFSLAHYIGEKDGAPVTDFFDVSVWGRAAKYTADHFGKGDRIAVAGKLRARKYEGRDGIKRVAVEIRAQDVSNKDAAPKAAGTGGLDFVEVDG